MLVLKKNKQIHFNKDFGGGSSSDRIILPGPDNCRVKITMFKPAAGFSDDNIVYTCDETVYVVSGKLTLTYDGGKSTELNPGDVYHVPAGTSYGARAITNGELLCVFSEAVDGKLPDNT